MTIGRLSLLASTLLLCATAANATDRTGLVELAQATPDKGDHPLTEAEKKKRQLEKQKKGPPPKGPMQPPKGPPADKKALPPDKKNQNQVMPPSAPGAAGHPVLPKNATPEFKRLSPPASVPSAVPKASPGPSPAPASANPPQIQRSPQIPVMAPKLDQIQKGRQQRVEDGGRRTVIQEPGNRTIVKQDNRIIIQHDDADRFRRQPNAQTQRRPDGIVETFYVRPDGFRIVTEVDANGRLMRRYRRGPDGREFQIIDNRRFYRTGLAVGVGALALAVALNLPPPVVTIPRDRYIVDYARVSDDDLYDTLMAPPVDRLERGYSLEEIRYNYELRDRMRRVDLDAINFEFGASDVSPDQFPRLERLARSIDRVLQRNPDEVFLIEGHTDAVGSDVDNLSLSDRRAEAVAQVLTDVFRIPPENLVTQGYGKQYLKIDTPESERANRRVAVRRITPLMSDR